MLMEAIDHLCSGCRVCVLACALENFQEAKPSLALLKIRGEFPSPGAYKIKSCNQCGACAKACPVDAIREKEGIYVMDYEECAACMICVETCPYGVIIQGENGYPYKCNGCGICVSLCPREALVEKK